MESGSSSRQSFDDFLKSIGIGERTVILSFRRVIAWRLAEALHQKGITTAELMARLMTRPADIDLFLDEPETAPLPMTTVREAVAAVGEPVVMLWETLQ